MSIEQYSTIKALNSMRIASKTIWEETVKNHSIEINEMVDSISLIYEWTNNIDKNYECSILSNEAVLDLFGSVNSIMNGYYRQGMFSLRSCLEMVVGLIYYVDHPIEYKRWRSLTGSDTESKFGKWIKEGLLTKDYILFFFPPDKVQSGLDTKLNELYGKLSKFIHGKKEENMQIDKQSMRLTYDAGRFKRSKQFFMEVVAICHTALAIRFWNEFQNSTTLKTKGSPLFAQFQIVTI